jgi:hypothetical protein
LAGGTEGKLRSHDIRYPRLDYIDFVQNTKNACYLLHSYFLYEILNIISQIRSLLCAHNVT